MTTGTRPVTMALTNVEYKPTEIATERLGQIMVKSGFFKDLREEAQAIVKILYGKELGFGPMASVLGVYIVEGKPSLSAQLIAAAIQKSDRYTYRVREWNAKTCRIEFFAARGVAGQGMESLGESNFTIEEAATAGLASKTVWKQYPKAMLWARAMSQGARAYTAEIFSGAIYTPDELGADVDGDGGVIEPLGDSHPFTPTRERDVDDAVLEEARECWMEACARADEQEIPHKALPPNAPLDQLVRWTAALNARLSKQTEEVPF
jgi:hypothetical protein